MKARPLPFISRMYFFFAMSPDTLAAFRPALAARSANFILQPSFMTVAQTSPDSGTSGSNRTGNRMGLAHSRHQNILRLFRQYFFLSQIAYLGEFSAGGLCFSREPLP